MDVGLATAPHRDLARRAAPIACAGALCVSAGFLATHDPAATGSPFPPCAFHQVTGLWCPGCGLTRGTYQLLHGHLGSALSYNVFTPLAVVAIAVAMVVWVRSSWAAPPVRLPAGTGRWLAIVVPTLVVVYAILRNIPVAPLQALAP